MLWVLSEEGAEQLQCPLCSATEIHTEASVRLETLLTSLNRFSGTEFGGSRSEGSFLVCLRRCIRCGLEFFNPTAVATAPFYETLESNGYYQSTRWDHATVSRAIEASESILDVGSGSGQFARTAQSCGANVASLDFVSGLIRTAVSESDQYMVDVSNLVDVLEFAESHRNSFDRVTMFHLVEHLRSPVEILNILKLVLKEGGLLTVSVPNRERFDLSPNQILDCPPHHQTRWALPQLAKLGEVLGAASVEIKQQRRRHVKYLIGGPLKWCFDYFRERPLRVGTVGRPWPPTRLIKDFSIVATYRFE